MGAQCPTRLRELLGSAILKHQVLEVCDLPIYSHENKTRKAFILTVYCMDQDGTDYNIWWSFSIDGQSQGHCNWQGSRIQKACNMSYFKMQVRATTTDVKDQIHREKLLLPTETGVAFGLFAWAWVFETISIQWWKCLWHHFEICDDFLICRFKSQTP